MIHIRFILGDYFFFVFQIKTTLKIDFITIFLAELKFLTYKIGPVALEHRYDSCSIHFISFQKSRPLNITSKIENWCSNLTINLRAPNQFWVFLITAVVVYLVVWLKIFCIVFFLHFFWQSNKRFESMNKNCPSHSFFDRNVDSILNFFYFIFRFKSKVKALRSRFNHFELLNFSNGK